MIALKEGQRKEGSIMINTTKTTYTVTANDIIAFLALQTKLGTNDIKEMTLTPVSKTEETTEVCAMTPFIITMKGQLLNKKGRLNGNIINAINPYAVSSFDTDYSDISNITTTVTVVMCDIIRNMFRESHPEYLSYKTGINSIKMTNTEDRLTFVADIENTASLEADTVAEDKPIQTQFVDDDESDGDIVSDAPDDFDVESPDEWDGEWDDLDDDLDEELDEEVESKCVQTYEDNFDREADTADLDKEIDEFLADSDESRKSYPFIEYVPYTGTYLNMDKPHSYKVLYHDMNLNDPNNVYAILVLISKQRGCLGGILLAEKDNANVSLDYSMYKDPNGHKFMWGETDHYQYLLTKFTKGYKPSLARCMFEFSNLINENESDELIKYYINHPGEKEASVEEVRRTMERLAEFLFRREK